MSVIRVVSAPLILTLVLAGVARAELRHHWTLDEKGGSVAADDVSGADGSLVGFSAANSEKWIEAPFNRGLDLGSDDTLDNRVAVTLPAMNAAETGGFTVAMWINPGEQINTLGEYQLLATPGDTIGFTVMNYDGELRHDRVLLFWDGNLPNLHVGTTTLEPGTWYHVAITSTGAGGEKRYYVNGAPEDQTLFLPSQGGTPGVHPGNVDGWGAGTGAIGALVNGARAHDTMMDDVRIYDEALDEAGIAAILANPPRPIPRHRWPLDERSGLTAADVESGASATLTNFEANDDSQWVSAQFAGGVDLGADESVNNLLTAEIPALSATQSGGFTVAMWLNPGEQILQGGEYQLFASPGGGVGFTIINATFAGGPFERKLLFWDSNFPNLGIANTTTLEPGTWYHVAITSTGAGGEKRYYVNAVEEDTALADPSLGGTNVGNVDGWPAGVATIGGLGGGRWHASIIDDVRIYRQALSAEQLQDILDNPPPAPPVLSDIVPADGDLFHDAGAGLSFRATGPGSPIDVAGISVTLNGVDVSGDLVITGTEFERTVSYGLLEPETLYQAAIEVVDSAGGLASQVLTFGTLTPSVEPGLVHHFRMDELSGLVTADAAAGQIAVLRNFEANDNSQWVEGRIDGGLDFGADETLNNLVVSASPGVTAATDGGFTIALWAKFGEQILSPGEYQLLFTPGDSIGLTVMNGEFEGSPADRVLLLWDGDAANLTVGTTSLEPGRWYHIVVSSTGAGGEKAFYINGVAETQRLLFPSQGGDGTANRDGWGAGELALGAHGSGARAHDTVLDEVRIYERVLAPDEVETMAGEFGSFHLPGDCTLDGNQDIADVVCYIRHIFGGFFILDRTSPPLPCASPELGSPGNIAVLDVNGDEQLDVSDVVGLANFLFGGGDSPNLGMHCFEVAPDLECTTTCE